MQLSRSLKEKLKMERPVVVGIILFALHNNLCDSVAVYKEESDAFANGFITGNGNFKFGPDFNKRQMNVSTNASKPSAEHRIASTTTKSHALTTHRGYTKTVPPTSTVRTSTTSRITEPITKPWIADSAKHSKPIFSVSTTLAAKKATSASTNSKAANNVANNSSEHVTTARPEATLPSLLITTEAPLGSYWDGWNNLLTTQFWMSNSFKCTLIRSNLSYMQPTSTVSCKRYHDDQYILQLSVPIAIGIGAGASFALLVCIGRCLCALRRNRGRRRNKMMYFDKDGSDKWMLLEKASSSDEEDTV